MHLLGILLLLVGSAVSFLLEHNATLLAGDKSYHELVGLIVDEKASRHQLEEKVAALTSRLDLMDQLHQQVSVQLDKDKNIREDLLGKLVNINYKLSNLQQNMSNVVRNVETMRNQFGNGNVGIGYNTSQLWAKVEEELVEMNKTILKYSTPSVGFSMSTPDKNHIATQARFTKITLNSDHMYNTNTDVVTIRVPGVYFFTVTIVREPGITQAYCCLHLNSQLLTCTVGYGSNSDGYSSGTASLLYQLRTGDKLTLWECVGIDHMHWSSSFSGFLIKADIV